MACFCNQESDRVGWYQTTFGVFNYHLRPNDIGNDALLELERQGAQPICKDYMLSTLVHDHFEVVTSVAIILMNLLYIKLIPHLVEAIGFQYKTTQSLCNTILLNLCMLTNSVILPVFFGFGSFNLD